MSEPKLISPMLDNFAIGGAISAHHGVSCYPAMENEFNDRYIVKIISVPPSQTQLDALLLTGAYSSLEAALSYFKETADGICKEVEILEKLSQLEGFLPYRSCQMELKEDGNGFEVYLLSPYRRTLARQFTRQPLTQLDALNLGLDMCAALSVCRRSGYMYVDLKPNNIYITTDKGYFIGDLGFMKLDSLKYASLPDRYFSEYTAPEIQDAFSRLNTTLDIYALGLILYQVYNNGTLPQAGEDGALVPPAYADYEMAEIIMKAIAADPAERWQEPAEFGQALVNYMQRNGADDVPIIPVTLNEEPASCTEKEPEAISNDEAQDLAEDVQDTAEDIAVEEPEESPLADAVGATDEVVQEKTYEEASEESVEEEIISEVDETDVPAQDALLDADTITEEETVEEVTEQNPQEPDTETSEAAEQVLPEPAEAEEEFINLSFLDTDEYALNGEDVSYEEISSELSDILSQADALLDLKIPEPVVAPEPIDVPIPEPISIEPEVSEEEILSEDLDLGEEIGTNKDSDAISGDTEEDEAIYEAPSKKRSRWVGWLVSLLIVAVLLAGAYYYYQNYYTQTINSVSVSGLEDKMTVTIDSTIDSSILTVVCADPHGNKVTSSVTDGKAEFTGLLPNTAYSVHVEIIGFHQLLGNTTATYSTPQQTNIVQFSAVTGSEDGSVILGFTVEGPDSPKWSVVYGTDGEEQELASFPGHTVALSGLTVGKEYTFTLIPEDELYLTGTEQISYTANKLVYAKNLKIESCFDNTLTATWSAPADTQVSSWTVRCNGENYSESIVTNETIAVFEGLDDTKSYMVEVIAAGMSVSQRTQIGEMSVTISDFLVDESVPGKLQLSWNANNEVSANGWILRIAADGNEVYPPIICDSNSAVIVGMIPDAVHTFIFEDVNGTDFLGIPITYKTAPAKIYTCNYEGYELTGDDISFRMCLTPDERNWNYYDVHDEDYRNVYAAHEKASFLMHIETSYGDSEDTILVTYVIKDSNKMPVSVDTQRLVWDDLWYRYYGELDIPSLPTADGEYTIDVYFDGGLVESQTFTISG